MKALLESLMDLPAGKVTDAQHIAIIQAVRREIHAGFALQGLMSIYIAPNAGELEQAARNAVKAADALIAELDKQA